MMKYVNDCSHQREQCERQPCDELLKLWARIVRVRQSTRLAEALPEPLSLQLLVLLLLATRDAVVASLCIATITIPVPSTEDPYNRLKHSTSATSV